jgi:hypothetical protein
MPANRDLYDLDVASIMTFICRWGDEADEQLPPIQSEVLKTLENHRFLSFLPIG